MNIGFVGMYYYPEKFSSRHLIKDITDFLRLNGNNVSLIVPNPVRCLSKEEIEQYKNKKEDNIIRLWCGKNNKNSIFARLIRIYRFNKSLKKYLKKNHNFDCFIIQSNPPIFSPLMIEKIAKKYSIKIIYYVDDIFPDILGKNNFLFRILKKMSSKSYLNADRIVSISEDVKDTLISKGVEKTKITIIKPWLYNSNANVDRTFFFDKNKFNISYIGNIGQFQNCEFILDIASEFNDEDIVFNIIGSGREENKIMKMIEDKKYTNIKFVSRLDESEAKELYKESDLNLIILKKNVIKYAMPSKTVNCVLSGKPCLLVCDESKYSNELVKKYNFYFDNSFNKKSVSILIKKIKADYNIKKFLKNKESDEFNMNHQLKMWEDVVNSLL